MSLRKGATVIVVLAAAIVVGAGIRFAAPVLVPSLFAVFLVLVTAPVVRRLVERGMRSEVAVTLGVLLDIGIITGLTVLVGTSLATFSARVPAYEARLQGFGEGLSEALARFGLSLPDTSIVEAFDGAAVMRMVGLLLQSTASAASQIVLVVLLVGFLLMEMIAFPDKLRRVTTPDDFRRIQHSMDQLNRYMSVKTGVSAVTGILLGAWCALLGIDLPILWGVLAFLLNYIPNIGSIIAAVPPLTLALMEGSFTTVTAVAAGYLAVNFVIGNVIEPRLMGRALGLSSFVVFLSMFLWGWLLGPVGALLSAPLTVILKEWLAQTEDLAWIAILLAPPTEPVPAGATLVDAADGPRPVDTL